MRKFPPGVLLLHGFTSGPDSVNILAPHLEALGIPYRIPTLRGHQTRPEDLEAVTWQDWLEDARQALLDLAQDGRQVIVVGQSLGGLLALDLGIEMADKVRAVVSLATPLRFANPLVYLLPLLQSVIPYWQGKAKVPDAEHPRLDVCYPRFPTRTFGQLYTYSHVVRRKLSRLIRPLLVLQATHDTAARPRSALSLFQEVSSTDKELVWYHRSEHALLCDSEREAVVERILVFVRRLQKEDETSGSPLSSLRLN